MNWKKYFNIICSSWLFLSFFVLCSFSTNAEEKHERFDRANKAYAKGNFEEAQRDYAATIQDGTHSFAVYYNLGNTYYRLGDLGHAVLYYEKARKLKPGNEEVKANIALVNSKLTDKVEPQPEFFLFRVWRGLFMALSLNTFAVLSLVFVWIAVGAFVLYLFGKQLQLKKIGFYASIALSFLAMLCMFFGNRQSSFLEQNKEGIIIPSSVTVKSAPEGNAKVLFIIHTGLKIKILEEQDSWVKIQLPNGNTGWAPQSDLVRI